jgi:hypothetical protein
MGVSWWMVVRGQRVRSRDADPDADAAMRWTIPGDDAPRRE